MLIYFTYFAWNLIRSGTRVLTSTAQAERLGAKPDAEVCGVSVGVVVSGGILGTLTSEMLCY